MASHELWHKIESLVDSDCGFRPCGQVSIAENIEEMQQLETRVQLLNSLGYTHEEIIDLKQLQRLAPTVASHCIGGIMCRKDGVADPYLTTRAFYNKAKQLGTKIYEHHPVTAIERTSEVWRVRTGKRTFEASIIINCAGAWGSKIAEMIGDRTPLTPRASILTVTARTSHFLNPVVILEGRKLSLKQMANGTVVIGGGHSGILNMKTEKTTIDFSNLKIMAQIVSDIFPLLKQVPIVRCWPGIIGDMPDKIPVIGSSYSVKDAYHAFGFSGHGFQLGPIIGKILTELIYEGRSSIPIDSFRIERFKKAV
jgi:sarcosine oxidase, subunit beta